MPPHPQKVAVIGGSAGSLAALQALFEALPPHCGVAYVVIQHLSQGHESVLPDLIAKWTALPVHGIEEGTALEADQVYVAKPGQFLEQQGASLHVLDKVAEEDGHRPIDVYARALAREMGSRSALVVLSGALDDGSRGAGAIKQAGGVVLIQDPAGAQYASMPEKALKTGHADRVGEPACLAEDLCSWSRTGRFDQDVAAEDRAKRDALFFERILGLVRDHSQNDMGGYKSSTLMRRIERRMSLSHVGGLEEYHQLLLRNAAEIDLLCKDLLIGVTAFFRDPEAFQLLQTQVVPAICGARSGQEPVRVWVAGCSTGEEAYSVAMLLLEWFEAQGQSPRVQIFATDIDDAALEVARAGSYDEVALEDMPPERRQRFFTGHQGGYRIAKEVRECIVFASHNLISDPPFSRLDLVVCRNLLIYLNLETQRKLLKLFRFVLNPGAYLFLGSSESLGNASRYFHAVSKPWRIYRHTAEAPRNPPRLPIAAGAAARRMPGTGETVCEPGALAVQERTFRELLERHGPTQLVVNGRNEVLYVAGNPAPYLAVAKGQPTHDLFKMVAHPLSTALRSALNRAQRTQARASVSAFSVSQDGAAQDLSDRVRIEVMPLGDGPQSDLLLVSFGQEAAQQGVLPQAGAGGDDWVLRQLEQELNATREDLQRTILRPGPPRRK